MSTSGTRSVMNGLTMQSSAAASRPGTKDYQPWTGASFTAKIPGRFVNPAKLENFLDQKFDEYYTVEMRNNFYNVTTPYRLTMEEIRRNC